jgi:hypothetical protein
MTAVLQKPTTVKPKHPWLRKLSVAAASGPTSPLLEKAVGDLLRRFHLHGHQVQAAPDGCTDVLLTTARFGQPLGWRQAPLFTARRRFGLGHQPSVFTLVHVSPAALERTLDHFRAALAQEPPRPADYAFPGLAPQAYRVLFEQGHRGGPILALERLVQAQTKSIRVILVVGDDRPLVAYHFDLVGAHPRSECQDPDSFYDDVVLRIVTAVSAGEVTAHQVTGDPIPRTTWRLFRTPGSMCAAGQRLGERNFFTEMVRIADLTRVPAVSDAVASQYSEGCFATWDPELSALIATVTGSARPVDKGSITEDDLAVIVGVRPDGKGALTRHVAGKRNAPPSSEAVEMMDVDSVLPTIDLGPAWPTPARVPVGRSKLHGHRGIAAYDPRRAEFVPLDPPYYHYPVSCGTDAQVRAIKRCFARSETLRHPGDPRPLAFTVLPGHGVVIVEKWVPGAAPFQVMWESMDAGALQVDNRIPQGPMEYVPASDGRMVLQTGETKQAGVQGIGQKPGF